jgi:C1A family cysteine protease
MTLGGLLLNRRTQRHYRLDGCRRSRVKPLLKLARPFLSLLTRQQLPTIIDLRSLLSPVEEQYTLGSCVGNALASILEYFYFYTTGHIKTFSRLFIYYNARMMEDEIAQRNATETDSGADLQFAIVSLIKYGCCEEQFWPFYEHLINIQPNNKAYENGQNYRLNEFSRLSNNINQLRECLAEGYPFVMAIKIFSSFASNHHGCIPMPKTHEKSSQYRHAVVCVGYIHSERVFIIRNSHGSQWGDHGYGYLPYEYVTDKILTKDLWAIKSIQNMMIPISIQQPIAWNNSSILSKSISQYDMTDDRSNYDIVYSSDDEQEELENKKYRRDHLQEHQREYSASPPPQQHQEENHLIQPPFRNNFSVVHVPPPMIFTNPSLMRPFPYHPSMFGSAPFFGPF